MNGQINLCLRVLCVPRIALCVDSPSASPHQKAVWNPMVPMWISSEFERP